MKIRFYFILGIILFIFPSIFIPFASATPSYVGVNENDTYTWTIEADEDVYKEFYSDFWGYELLASADAYEDNDNFTSAANIGEGEYYNLDVSDDDEDWYKVYVSEGSYLEVVVYFDHFDGDIDLELYDNNEELIDDSFSITDNEGVCYKADYTGYYYILIYLCEEGTNSYDLLINIGDKCEYSDDYEEESAESYDKFYSTPLWDWEAVRIEIKDIRGEMEDSLYGNYVPIEIDMDFSDDYAGGDWHDTPYQYIFIFDPESENFAQYFYIFTLPLIEPANVDWDEVVGDLVDYLGDMEGIRSVSTSKMLFDYHITIEFEYSSYDDIEIIFRYNDKGILEYGEVLYGGVRLGKVEIVGLNIYTLIAIIAVAIAAPAIIGLIYFFKKRGA